MTKTIAGPLASQQGTVTIHTVCDNALLAPDFVIPAGTAAGESQIYSGIATPATCVVTETTDGHSSTVPIAVVGSPQTVTIPPGGAGAAHITDSYGPAPGSLMISKSIAGQAPDSRVPSPCTRYVTARALSPTS